MANGKKNNKSNVAEMEEIAPVKLKKEFDLDPIEVLPIEKADDAEIAVEGEEAEDEADGPELDDEELNPFKDKWEE